MEKQESDKYPQQIKPTSPSRMMLISGVAALIGILSGIISFVLYHLIGFFTNLAFFQRFSFTFANPHERLLGTWAILVPVVGAFIVGLLAKYGSKKIIGHGIPEAMEAVIAGKSKIEPKVAILKPLSAAIAIGTGGPFGAEGPIIQTGGALGSTIGQLFRTTAAEKKILLACGAAAGMAATFNTPVAGMLLAIELLLFEFKSRSFIPLAIATTIATAVRFSLLGQNPMFTVSNLNFDIFHAWPFYVLLGLICGIAAVAVTRFFYWVEDFFGMMCVHNLLKPMIGALVLGIIGYFVPRIFGVGYDTISDILNNRLDLAILLAILFGKSIAVTISLGAETSGGLLAPLFMVGAALGGVFAMIMNQIFPSLHLPPGAFALVAMGALFGAAARATFTFIIFAFEISRDYNAILPLIIVAVIADGVALSFLRHSIMTEKLARRGLLIPQDYEIDMLARLRVSEIMDKNVTPIPGEMKLSELASRIAQNQVGFTFHQAFPVVDKENRLAGIITRGDLVRALSDELQKDGTTWDAASHDLVTTYPDEPASDAATRMLQNNLGRLLVVSRENPRRLVGYVGRAAILSGRLRRLEEEHIREPGLFFGRENHDQTETSL